MSVKERIQSICHAAGFAAINAVPEGFDGYILGEMAKSVFAEEEEGKAVLHIARDDQRMEAIAGALRFFAPDVKVVQFPAWDCVPYDRVSPNQDITAKRLTALARLSVSKIKAPTIVLSTVNAVQQRVPSRKFMRQTMVRIAPGNGINMEKLIARIEAMGFVRSGTVMEVGEYAVRGGILDLFPTGHSKPIRLDFFGDTLESLRQFDAESQRTTGNLAKIVLMPISELAYGKSITSTFRQRYVELFGAVKEADPLYEAVSSGSRFQGMEHWLPLFHNNLETLFDYLPNALVSFDNLAEDARKRRMEQIVDHYESRYLALEQSNFGAAPYKPVPHEMMFLSEEEWNTNLEDRRIRTFSPFETPDDLRGIETFSFEGRHGRSFAAERSSDAVHVFDTVVKHIADLQHRRKKVVVACWSVGARERLGHLLSEHGLKAIKNIESWQGVDKLVGNKVGLAVLGIETGFETPDYAVIGEQDILGDRLVRSRKKAKKGADVLSDAASLSVGDYIVHADHGIGRFTGLKTIEAVGAPHDCLVLMYHGDDRLYLPVENIELLTRYGSDDMVVQLDRLGGSAWQSRKAKLKQRIREIADQLIKVAAVRALKEAPVLQPPEGVYEEFCARFPYEETEDQETSIHAVIDDLASGKPMDRLVCGDVGFGKTEVALRSAMVAVMAGKQVAVVVPTTLLARQHYTTFVERFKGFPIKLAQASRLVGNKELNKVKQEIKEGQVDIVVGTHALLGKGIEFNDLGLLIIDEEQHFGVQHKERLKLLREDIHVLTLTATPIPRTLQLALTGVRELSLITTPPVDRLAVRTFISPFDPVILREALLRERYRGGQSFYVCPRISDLAEIEEFLKEHVPELKVAKAHGQMAPGQLEDIMNAFYDREYDVLLSTTIVESGLDIPTANTLIIHRADMFGLAQLYQLRGRVGRSKTRAYAYFTIPADKKMTDTAEKRLKVLQSLDTLGAGFNLASHDMDIRGAGNLLGDEQSGHIKEVGFELYQSMLEEAVAMLKGGGELEVEDQWSPQIAIGTAVLIPDKYVPDLQLRLDLYRRLSKVEDPTELEGFAAELVDRFGEMPDEVRYLLEIVRIKSYCRQANIEQVEAGPKGAVVTFRRNEFANPDGLIAFVNEWSKTVKIQPDQKILYQVLWDTPEARLKGVRSLVKKLAEIAAIRAEDAAA
ncbi:MAG: transcription-repair coupling factor [Methyloligellaceae bacterium]